MVHERKSLFGNGNSSAYVDSQIVAVLTHVRIFLCRYTYFNPHHSSSLGTSILAQILKSLYCCVRIHCLIAGHGIPKMMGCVTQQAEQTFKYNTYSYQHKCTENNPLYTCGRLKWTLQSWSGLVSDITQETCTNSDSSHKNIIHWRTTTAKSSLANKLTNQQSYTYEVA